ncbi:hypothetical protein OOK41_31785 [Micromonospora sp. NBC_01655]|uniref:hypothetical protein n=1 Tax=Micromonospora sp. NBC_01655 TaxID=2975983 RepID=UPI00225AD94E|nr:hypothetical protein [Micromonospora sp. NBC_01655]MCX4468752.1 hypothetical protein [Micromonospora sp. NBC_01655]MCX4474843.1 hypothetical protein [Micromonospora sp. NBC_01655]
MTTTDTPTTALDLDAIRPATDLLITQLREALGEIKAHTHPASGEDFNCLNLVSWLGERMGPVLRRLADEQAETRKWQERNAALADEFTAEADRFRAALAAEQTRTSRLEDALAATEQQAASMRIALDRADAEAEGR